MKRALLRIALLWLVVYGAACSAPVDGPSILLVTVDTLRADALGCYGAAPSVSPHLDRLALRSTVFERAYATAPITAPSHASILTAQHPSSHGIVFNGHRVHAAIAERSRTVAEHLLELGYRTGAVISGGPLGDKFGFGRGFERKWRIKPAGLKELVDKGGEALRVSRTAADWIDEQDGPWFLWVHYFDPHLPYQADPEVWSKVGPGGPRISKYDVAETAIERIRSGYRAEVFEVDRAIGALLEHIDASTWRERTVIALTADHGEYLGEHGRYGHQELYDEVLHVPMLLHEPGIRTPRRVSATVSTIDLVPTLLAMLELPPLEHAQGRSLLPADQIAPRPVFAEWRSFDLARANHPAMPSEFIVSVRDGRYAYIHDLFAPGSSQLFELSSDPDESRNVFASLPQESARMQELLTEHARDRLPDGRFSTAGISVDRDSLEMLRALGYLE
ncbi:MAG: sulfatase [Deltaproteobacteria bacterium]|nr:sulfatase [Deltaproteobacteria bacterium]